MGNCDKIFKIAKILRAVPFLLYWLLPKRRLGSEEPDLWLMFWLPQTVGRRKSEVRFGRLKRFVLLFWSHFCKNNNFLFKYFGGLPDLALPLFPTYLVNYITTVFNIIIHGFRIQTHYLLILSLYAKPLDLWPIMWHAKIVIYKCQTVVRWVQNYN